MMTRQEMHDEFWILTKSVLQDSRIDTNEARVIKRWLEEHRQYEQDGAFDAVIKSLARILEDNYVDRFESTETITAIGRVLKLLNTPQ